MLLGDALLDRNRDDVVISVKFGALRDPAGGWSGYDGRPEAVRNFLAYSLSRLRTEYVDIYRPARLDPAVPIEETVGAIAEMVREGYVRNIGLSEVGAEALRRAHAVHPISALQTEYSLWTRDPEEEILPACRELGIGFVPYSPLGRGFLTGRFARFEDLPTDDYRRNNPRFQGDNFQKNLDLVAKVKQLAREKGCTPSQLALAWLLAQGRDVVPIPGTKRRQYLEENIRAADVVLAPDDLRRLAAVAPLGVAAGMRYPEGGMRTING